MWRFLPSVSDPGAGTSSSSTSGKRDRDLNYEKQKRRRPYRKEWEAEYKWLAYDEEKGLMYCKTCRATKVTGDDRGKKQNSFYKGNNTFKVETIKAHGTSENHQLAIDREKAAKAAPGTSPAEVMLKGMNVAAVKRLQLLFRNAHAIAHNCRPFTDYIWMSRLDSAKGLDVGSVYHTDKAARTFVHFIAEVERLKLKEAINKANFISLISDGTTDASITEAEILYVRYSINGTSHTHLVGVQSVSKADATSITNCIIEAGLQKRLQIDKEILKKKLVGFGSDGASVMIGRNNGVATQLKRYSPVIQAVHCTAHRLELAFKDALKPVALFTTLSNLLLNLYLFYRRSSKNRSGLKRAAEAEHHQVAIPTRAGGTRWLPHLQRALQQMLRGYKALLTHLRQVEAEPGMSADARGKAKQYVKYLRRHDLMKFTHFMVDVVTVLSKVSLTAQVSNNTVAEVAASIDAAVATLSKYKTRKMTPKLNDFGDAGMFKDEALTGGGDISTAMANVLTRLNTSLEGRFEDMNSGVLSSFRIASFKFWPMELETSEDFGDEYVAELVKHFLPVLKEAGVDADEVAVEWDLLKHRLYAKYKPITNAKWAEAIPAVQEELPNISSLVDLMLTIPASSADAERGFSRLKLLKTDQRTRLHDDSVTDQLMVMLHTATIEEFDTMLVNDQNVWVSLRNRIHRAKESQT